MPPTPTASTPKGKVKPGAKGQGLAKRVGPFALWVWLVMGAGAAVVAYLYMRNRSGGDGGGGFVETVTGNQTASPMEQAYGGGPSGGSSDGFASQIDPSTLETLISEQIQPYLASAGDLRGHVYELEDAFANSGYTMNEDKTWTPPGTSEEAVLDSTLGPPGGGPQQGAQTQTTAAGVRFGGQTFSTKAGLASFLAGSPGGPKGRSQAYRQWATKHPGAAKKLAGPPPKPVAKKQPARTTPKAKAPVKQKAQAKPVKKKAPANQKQKVKVRR